MTSRNVSNLNRIIYTMMFFGSAFVTMTSTLIGVTLPEIQCWLGVDLKTSTSLLLAYGLGLCCSNLTGHFIKDKMDTFLLLAAILVLNAVAIAAVPTSPFLWLTIFLVLVAGWCTGTCTLVRTLHCFVIWPKNAFIVTLVQSGASLNAITVPLVCNLFRHSRQGTSGSKAFYNTTRTHPNSAQRCNGFNTIHYTYLIMSILCLLVASSLMHGYNTIPNDGDVTEVRPPIKRKPKVYSNTSSVFICLTICFNFTIATCFISFQELFVTFGIRTQLNLSLSDMSVMYSVFSVAFFLSRLCSVVLTARISLDMMMVFFVLLSSITSVLFLIFKDASIMMMWTNSLLFAVGIGPLLPGFLAWVKENSDGSPRLLNVVLFSKNVAFLISPVICGHMMDMIGADAFVYMVSGAGLLQCVLFIFISYHNWKTKHSN